MGSLVAFVWLLFVPALLCWGLVRLLKWHYPEYSRRKVLAIAVPTSAFLPLIPAAVMIAQAQNINNAALIAVMATALVGTVIALVVCLPTGIAAISD